MRIWDVSSYMNQSELVAGTSVERNIAYAVIVKPRSFHLKYLLLVIANILAVLESHESVLVSFASPVLKVDTLTCLLVIAPPWEFTSTWSGVNV